EKPRTALHLAFTYQGLAALDLPDETLSSFAQPFIEGAVARASVLCDTGKSAPDQWDLGGHNNPPIHAIMILFGARTQDFEQLVQQERALVAASNGAVRDIAVEEGHRTHGGKEHFGYHDGVSQPQIEGLERPERGYQDTVVAGEFILGYLNAYGLYPVSPVVPASADPKHLLPSFPDGALPESRDLGRNGSYIIYRKLAQDVGGFWNFIERNSDGQSTKMLQLAAKFVGRWPSGAPLILAPEADNPNFGDKNNFFFMKLDPNGLRCPLSSHIRRANPRDSRVNDTPADSLKTSSRHRIIRRATLYGDPLMPPESTHYPHAPVGLKDDGKPRGLHFFAITSNIARQFEFVQQTWCNTGSFNAEFDILDPVIGDNNAEGFMTLQAKPYRRRICDMPCFVDTKGSSYLFLPSITALRYLAEP